MSDKMPDDYRLQPGCHDCPYVDKDRDYPVFACLRGASPEPDQHSADGMIYHNPQSPEVQLHRRWYGTLPDVHPAGICPGHPKYEEVLPHEVVRDDGVIIARFANPCEAELWRRGEVRRLGSFMKDHCEVRTRGGE